MTVHVATSQELGRIVRRGLRVPVRFLADHLLVGPCAPDAEAHVRARCEFWGLLGRERTRFLTSFRQVLEAAESGGRVVVWTSRLWADTIAFWAFCGWRLASGRHSSVDVVVLGGSADDHAPQFDPQYI